MDTKLAALACRPEPEEDLSVRTDSVATRVEDAVLSFLRALVDCEPPRWLHKKPRSYKRVMFDVSTGTNRAVSDKPSAISLSHSPRGFLLMLTIGLALQNLHMTKRDLYYAHAGLFGAQALTRTTGALLTLAECNITIATPNGVRNGMGTPSGLLIEASFAQATSLLSSPAQFVLLIEKEAVFQRLLRDGFEKQWRCIMVTGKGYPDIVTRVFVRRLRLRLGLPVLALCDWDPHGIEILATYKFGSCAMSNSVGLAVPGIRWLGIHSADLGEYQIPDHALLPLGDRERSRAVALASRECMSLEPQWLYELREMQRRGSKAEIESLSARGVRFLCEEYLPQKLREGKWHA